MPFTHLECPYRVVFHAGAQIGDYPTIRSAILAAEGSVLATQRRVNIYPRTTDTATGPRMLEMTYDEARHAVRTAVCHPEQTAAA